MVVGRHEKMRHKANKAATMSRAALEPAKNESNLIDKTMLDNARVGGKENVAGQQGEWGTLDTASARHRVLAAMPQHLPAKDGEMAEAFCAADLEDSPAGPY